MEKNSMFCENCGSKLEDRAIFCPNCGARIGEDSMAAPVQPETQQPEQPIEKKPMEKKQKVLIAEIAVLVLLVIALFKVGNHLTNPKYVAEKYFEAEVDGDSKKAFEYLDLPQSTLLTYENYEKYMENNAMKSVSNYKVKEGNSDSSYLNGIFGSDAKENDAITKTYVCEYIATGDNSQKTEELQLVKQKSKKWLLFDNWKVCPASLISGFTVDVYNGMTVLMDGKNVSELAVSTTQDQETRTSYTLPVAFPMQYDFVTQAPGCKDVTESIDLAQYYYGAPYSMQLSDDSFTALKDLSEDIIQTYYEKAFNQESWDSVKSSVNMTAVWQSDGKQRYDYLKDNFKKTNYKEYKSREFSDFKEEAGDVVFNPQISVAITIDYNYTDTGIDMNEDWWTGKVTKEPFSSDSSSSAWIQFVYEDGNWVVDELSL